jgi:paraquat-inducible protein B
LSTAPSPVISRKHAFPLIWVVPLIALAIVAWIGISELHDRGTEVTIDFADGSGVEAGRTVLEYKGVAAGTVESVELRPGLVCVSVRLRLKRNASALANSGGRFWIVHPEISFSGVNGLDTLVTGVRINVLPGTGSPSKHFRGLDRAPAPDVVDQGRTFILQCEKLGSLTSGAPIFYREFKVGKVEASHLSEDSTSVLIRIHLDAPYGDLVRTSSKFWNTGGFSFNVSLFGGAQFKDTSLESLVTGGVAFATPDTGPLAPAAPNNAEFTLASEPDKEWLKWSPRIPLASPDSTVDSPPKGNLIKALIEH